jgi:DNA-binding NarL/FixJ family response regulator
VIAISGAFGGSYLKTARRLGATATLAKPIDPETLLRAVREALAR